MASKGFLRCLRCLWRGQRQPTRQSVQNDPQQLAHALGMGHDRRQSRKSSQALSWALNLHRLRHEHE